MTTRGDEHRRDRREVAKDRAIRDVERLRRRVAGGGFTHSLALLGSVGWPIAALSVGGAFLGHEIDRMLGTRALAAAFGLALGAILGTYVAFRAVDGDRR